MVTEKGGTYYQIGIIHGSLAKCTNKFPGIFVRLDHPKILAFIQNELGIKTSSDENPKIKEESTRLENNTGTETFFEHF